MENERKLAQVCSPTKIQKFGSKKRQELDELKNLNESLKLPIIRFSTLIYSPRSQKIIKILYL